MLKEQARFITKINASVDVAAVFASFLLAYQLRGNMGGLDDIHHYAWILLVAIPVWVFLLNYFGLYASKRVSTFGRLLVALLKVHVVGFVIVASAIYLIEPHGVSRIFIGLFVTLTFVIISALHMMTRSFLRLLRSYGYNFRTILLVGTRQTAERIISLIEMHKSWGLRIVGIIQPDDGVAVKAVKGYSVLGRIADMESVCKSTQIDEVIFCATREEGSFDISCYIKLLETLGITSRTVLSLFYNLDSKPELSMFHDEVPLLTYRPIALSVEQLFMKRCIDIGGGIIGLLLSLLLLPFIALAVKLESPGPLFFGQTRVGENGRTFVCWKFRSMYIDAEERKKELLHLNEMAGAIFKIKDDPRITRVGRFLRKTSLDELPQFWNVLKGEMSLIGTRPPTPDEVAGYENWQRKRICIKPGISGLWQVSGRNSITDFNEIVRLDLEYIDSWSLGLDFRLIMKTFQVVFQREGSC